MPRPNDLSRSTVALNEAGTLLAVIEMGLASWLIAGRIPGVNRNPLRKQDPDPELLLARLHRWRRPSRPDIRLTALPLRSKPAGTVSGLRAGCGHEASKHM